MHFIKYTLLFITIFFTSCSQEKLQESDQLLRAGIHAPDIKSIARQDSITAFQIDTFFTKRFEHGQFNGVVLFAEKGRLIYRKSFGYSDLTRHRQLKHDTKFQLASVSKQFTAFAIMMLNKQGFLNYSDNVSKYVPNFPYPGITIHDLLTHHSGLPNYMHFSEKYWPDKKKYMTNKDVVTIMQKYKPEPYFQAGSKFNYSNTGYLLLATIVERVSKQSFPSFLQKQIFQPLEMNHTFVLNRAQLLSDTAAAVGYYSPNRRAEDSFMNGVLGDKGVVSTVDDLLKWDQALYQGKLLGKKKIEEAFFPSDTTRYNRSYGYGWRILNPDSSEKIVYHGGLWKGFRTLFVRKLKQQRTIIILSNIASNRMHLKELTEIF